MSEGPKRYALIARVALVALLAALLVSLAVWLYQLFSSPDEGTKKRAVQQIELVKPPPPPPPPKTPPPQQQEKIDVPKPEASPAPAPPTDAPPPGPTSSLPGNGSSDAFGLPQGDGRTSIGPVGGGGGDRFAWYGALVKERITDAIARDEKLRKAQDYLRVVNVWVDTSGRVTRVELVGAATSPELDDALRAALRNLAPVREGPPGDMPQPIRLRVSARS